jgi:hypothetical protein
MGRRSVAASLAICVVVLGSLTEAAYDIGSAGFPKFPGQNFDDGRRNGDLAYESCKSVGLRLCPTHTTKIGPHFNTHMKCILPKAKQMPKYCQAPILDMEHCIHEIDQYCDGLDQEDTLLCMDIHVDKLSHECNQSMFMSSVHKAAGRNTDLYIDYYHEFRELQRSILGEDL